MSDMAGWPEAVITAISANILKSRSIFMSFQYYIIIVLHYMCLYTNEDDQLH